MAFQHKRKVVTRTINSAALVRRYAGPHDPKTAVYRFSGGKTKYEYRTEPIVDSGEGVPHSQN